MVQAGVAVPNQSYDPDVPFSEPVLVSRPGRILSFDETRVEIDQTEGGKARKDH